MAKGSRDDIPTVEVEAPADPTTGFWECLADPKDCELPAPDPRHPAVPFRGPTQKLVRERGEQIACPKCGGQKVRYVRDEKPHAAVAA